MAILSINTDITGQTGMVPRIIRIQTNDSFATITTANYLKSPMTLGYEFYPTDLVAMTYGTNTTQLFTLTITSTTITLVPQAGSIATASVNGDFAVFNGTKGALKDSSFSPTDATKTKVVMANAATVVNNLAFFADTAGTIKDLGARPLTGTTGAYGGGGTSNAFAVIGLSAACVGAAVIRTSTNAVSICKALPGTDSLTITFSADPGAGTTVDYNYSTASLS